MLLNQRNQPVDSCPTIYVNDTLFVAQDVEGGISFAEYNQGFYLVPEQSLNPVLSTWENVAFGENASRPVDNGEQEGE